MSLRLLARVLLAALSCVVALAAVAGDAGPTWEKLSRAQQQVLAPLQSDWPSIEGKQRQKWLELAARHPRMPAEERQLLQARMSEWSRMTPAQRATARQQFQEVRRVPDDERRASWQAYQSLPSEERERLALQRPQLLPDGAQKAAPMQGKGAGARDGGAKRNIVAAPVRSVPRAVSSGVQQTGPGATTKPLTASAAPPLHHQTGLPKIAATSNFVDPQTLLPQKGPQGAAVRRAAPASSAEAPPLQ